MNYLKRISSVVTSFTLSAVVTGKGNARFTEFNTMTCSATTYYAKAK